jgi:basic membrane protein A
MDRGGETVLPKRLTLGIAMVAIVLSACNGPAATPAKTTTPSVAGSVPAATGSPAGSQAAGLKIGLVTDVGVVDDKSFNEYSWKGAQKGAADVGGTANVLQTKQPSDYATNIQTFIDQGYNIIVTTGFALGNATTLAAKAHPEINFIGVDQGICIDAAGAPDPTFGCKGDASTLLPNYQGIVFNEAQPGYLAGIVAASISKTGVIGAVGGINTIPAILKYIKGYENAAKSVNPNIKVIELYISDDITKAFNDPTTGKSIGTQMIGQKADVLFQVAGLSGQGVLSAACDANVYGIGVDVDQHLSVPNTAKCTVTSAEKKLLEAVDAAIIRVSKGTDVGGNVVADAAANPPLIGLSPFYDLASLITPDTQKKIDDALAAMKAGTLDPCKPAACDKP